MTKLETTNPCMEKTPTRERCINCTHYDRCDYAIVNYQGGGVGIVVAGFLCFLAAVLIILTLLI